MLFWNSHSLRFHVSAGYCKDLAKGYEPLRANPHVQQGSERTSGTAADARRFNFYAKSFPAFWTMGLFEELRFLLFRTPVFFRKSARRDKDSSKIHQLSRKTYMHGTVPTPSNFRNGQTQTRLPYLQKYEPHRKNMGSTMTFRPLKKTV